MLKKENRSLKRRDFEEIKRVGRYYTTPLLGMMVLKLAGEKRFGVVVSKKVSKKAVERNRLRRLVSEGVRKNLEEWPEAKVVFLIRGVMLNKKASEIFNEVDKLRGMVA